MMVRRLRQELYRRGGIDLWMALAASAIAILMLVAASEAQAQTFQVLHTFTGGDDGGNPVVGLTMDRAGNLYGTAQFGGTGNCTGSGLNIPGCGTVFKLTHRGSGWTFTPLYSFQGWNPTDGAYPQSRVTIASDGSLYGATAVGGLLEDCFPGCGTVYRLQPPATVCNSVSCQWRETVLHRFTAGQDGNDPTGDLTLDSSGNVYGTTFKGGGGSSNGTVYEISPSGGGWNESILYNFTGGLVGAAPYSGVIFDAAGNLNGTATDGGENDFGTVFQLTPSSSGWTGSALWAFSENEDGYGISAGLILDSAGNLYGATANGYPNGQAVVFELARSGGGWSYIPLYGFEGVYGAGPRGKLLMDSAGNLYGTVYGAYETMNPYGSVFKLTPSDGAWIYTDLYDFTGGSDGAYPYDGLIMDADGKLYGTTSAGGNSGCQHGNGCGVVFEITP
jgi:uncharacterized repeat protein (TIGR03803 family)